MSSFFLVPVYFSVIGFILGLIKPSIFEKILGKNATKPLLSLIWTGIILVLLVLVGVTAPNTDNKSKTTSEQKANPPAEVTTQLVTQGPVKSQYEILSKSDAEAFLII